MKYKHTCVVKEMFDRKNGNSYHSFFVISHESGEVVQERPKTYGIFNNSMLEVDAGTTLVVFTR